MKAGDHQRPNSLLCFFACHVILMVHTDLQDGDQSVVVLRIARLFSRFIENQTTVYSKFDKKRFTEPCRVPLPKDDAHRRWRDEWLGELKKNQGNRPGFQEANQR